MDLSIIIVNWKSEDYLRECLPSIRHWTHGMSYEVIVVDNASPSGNADRLEEQFPHIKLINSSRNLGFAGANNLGFRQTTGEYVLFLNPDTKLNGPAIDILMREIKRLPRAGIVGCKLLNADLSVQTSSVMKFPGIWNRMFQVEYLRRKWPKLWGIDVLFAAKAEPAEVEAVSGACMLMSRKIFEQIGMFSEEYFMYSEDLDLCLQAIRAGFKNYHVGDATIVHYGGKSGVAAWQAAMKTAAELHFCGKNYGRLYALLFRITMVAIASARLLALTAVRPLAGVLRWKPRLESAWLRWTAILETLLTSRNSIARRPMLPGAS